VNNRTQRYRIWLILLVVGRLVAGFVSFSSGDWLRGILVLKEAAAWLQPPLTF
jgi:uncharacterized membrane protein YjjP (DUF1212 family)